MHRWTPSVLHSSADATHLLQMILQEKKASVFIEGVVNQNQHKRCLLPFSPNLAQFLPTSKEEVSLPVMEATTPNAPLNVKKCYGWVPQLFGGYLAVCYMEDVIPLLPRMIAMHTTGRILLRKDAILP